MGATVERLDGVTSAELNFASATLLIEYELPGDPRAAVVRAVESTGHGLASLDEPDAPENLPPRRLYERYRAEVAAVGGGVLTALGMVLGWLSAPPWAVTSAFAGAILFGGTLVWRRALMSLRARRLDMNVLMTIAVLGAAVLGEWGEGATVFFLFALGGLLEARSLERTRRSIRGLIDLTPPTALVADGAGTIAVPVADVRVGETVVVRPGDRVALDGVVTDGASALDESPITGESVAVDKSVGDRVYAGSLNTSGVLRIEVAAESTDSTLARIVYMVEEAQAARAPSQRLVDRFSAWYTPSVVVFAAVLAVVPPALGMITGLALGSFSEWVGRALVMLVVACPCALVISTPVSIVSAISRAGRDGVLVKGGAFLEAAAAVKVVAFDKTGTLTEGRPRVVGVSVADDVTPEVALQAAAALEAHSAHPLGRAIVMAAEDGPPGLVASEVVEHAGRGVTGVIDGVTWALGTPSFALAESADEAFADAVRDRARALGATPLVLARDRRPVATISVADAVRPEARGVVSQLTRGGIEHTAMLTGDGDAVAAAVAEQSGVDSYLARLLPAAKTDAVRVLQERYGSVAMVGDGVNDAPALATADVGIAMGAAGSDTALETADVALMSDDLRALPGFFDLSRRTVRVIWQNVAFSIGVKAIVLVLALFGLATMWMAVFADTGVALLVILNGMRLARRRSA